MRILVIGAGAREHALCWALHRSDRTAYLACLPGNGGTSDIAESVALSPMDFAACAEWAVANAIDLTIIGPDDPLGGGIVDVFQARGLRCFGPTAAAARIESSKVWSKAFMQRHGIPTATARVVTAPTLEEAVADLYAPEAVFPVVVKADGLAAGKGVVIANDAVTTEAELRGMISAGRLGSAGNQVVIEQFLQGREVSVFAICDGQSYRSLGTACDYKRAYDGDQGPNTGGMGAYAPADWLTFAELAGIERTIIAPTIAGMAAEGCPFTGFLYAGVMMTDSGPMVIEFNARFGDPEAQVILPLLRTPLLDLIEAAVAGQLATLPTLEWEPGATCGVVIAAEGYPATPLRDVPITGLDELDPALLAFHAGTRRTGDGTLLANGGRLLTLVGQGVNRAAARASVYSAIDQVHIARTRWRSDIAAIL